MHTVEFVIFGKIIYIVLLYVSHLKPILLNNMNSASVWIPQINSIVGRFFVHLPQMKIILKNTDGKKSTS